MTAPRDPDKPIVVCRSCSRTDFTQSVLNGGRCLCGGLIVTKTETEIAALRRQLVLNPGREWLEDHFSDAELTKLFGL
jgi:hypothetical protein